MSLWFILVHFLFCLPALRRKEKKLLEKMGLIQSLNNVIFLAAPIAATMLLFLTHIQLQMNLTSLVVSVLGTLSPTHTDREFSHVSFPSSCPSEGFANR